MAGTLGTITGEVRINVQQAIASYAALRAANASTLLALRGSNTAMLAFGKASTIAGAAMVAGFVVAANAAADFEKQLDFFGAVSGSTEKQMEAVRKKALQLGQDTIYSAGQIADSFVELGKAGVSAEDIIGGIGEAVANLGAAADIPLDQAAIIMTSAVQQYHLAAEDAVHVTDLLAGAANASIVEVEDLGVSLKYVGGVANAFGFSIEDTIDALSLLGKAGIRGSTAGTSLRQILVSLTGTSGPAKEALKDLGIITEDGSNKFFDAEGNAKRLSQVFQILQDATAGLSKEQRGEAFDTIFQNRALASALELTHAGAKGFRAMHDEIGDTTAADVAHERLDNLKGDIEILRGNIETLLIKAGTPFQNFLRMLVQGITKVVQAFSALPEGVQTGIFAFLGIVGVLLTVMGIIAMVGGVITGFGHTLMLLAPVLRLLATALSIVTGAIRALALAFVASPLGWVVIAIAAIVAILVLLYMKSEAFRNFIDGVGRALLAAFKAVVAWFKGLPAFFQSMWEKIKNFFSNPTDYIKDAWENIVEFFKSLPGKLLAVALSILRLYITIWGKILSFVLSIAGKIVSGVVSFLAQLPGRIISLMGMLLSLWARLWLFLFSKAVELAGKIVSGVVNFISQLPGKIGYLIGFMVGRVIRLLLELVVRAIALARRIVAGIVNFIAKLPGRVANFFSNLKNKAISLFSSLVPKLISLAQRIVAGIVDFIAKLPGRIADLFTRVKDKAIELFHTAVDKLVQMAKDLPGKIRDGIGSLPGIVGDILDKMIQTIKDAITGAFNAVKDFGSAMWEGFKSGIGMNSPSYFEKAMFQINDTMTEEGKKLADNLKRIQKETQKLREPMDASNSDMDRRTKQFEATTKMMLERAKALHKQQLELEKTANDHYSGVAARNRGILTGDLNVRSRNTPVVNVKTPDVKVVSPGITQNVYGSAGETALDASARRLRDIVDAGRLRV